jgi:hypothetical protein
VHAGGRGLSAPAPRPTLARPGSFGRTGKGGIRATAGEEAHLTQMNCRLAFTSTTRPCESSRWPERRSSRRRSAAAHARSTRRRSASRRSMITQQPRTPVEFSRQESVRRRLIPWHDHQQRCRPRLSATCSLPTSRPPMRVRGGGGPAPLGSRALTFSMRAARGRERGENPSGCASRAEPRRPSRMPRSADPWSRWSGRRG